LCLQKNADLAKDRALLELKVLLFDLTITWVVDVDLDNSFRKEENVCAILPLLDKHVFWLTQLCAKLRNQLIEIGHICELFIISLDLISHALIVELDHAVDILAQTVLIVSNFEIDLESLGFSAHHLDL